MIERSIEKIERSIEKSIGRIEKKLSLTDNIVYVGNVKFYIPNFPIDLIQSVIAGGSFFEEEILKHIDKYLDRNSVVLDLGANLGNHTLYWSKVTDGVGVRRVYAFEPVDTTFSLLKKNIQINGLDSNKVIINEVGLGKTESSAEIKKFNIDNIGGTQIRARADGKGPFKIISLDSYIKSSEFKDEKIDLIKIDVEGFEEDLLYGAKETLEKYNPVIFIEAWPENFEKIDKLLNSFGYELEEKLGNDNYLYIKQTNSRKILETNRSISYL
jgi:FkbM family methyltransferase